MVKQIIMDEELHTQLKIRASTEKRSIKGLVAELVKKYLNIKMENSESAKE